MRAAADSTGPVTCDSVTSAISAVGSSSQLRLLHPTKVRLTASAALNSDMMDAVCLPFAFVLSTGIITGIVSHTCVHMSQHDPMDHHPSGFRTVHPTPPPTFIFQNHFPV
jgi:hypothetical protein